MRPEGGIIRNCYSVPGFAFGIKSGLPTMHISILNSNIMSSITATLPANVCPLHVHPHILMTLHSAYAIGGCWQAGLQKFTLFSGVPEEEHRQPCVESYLAWAIGWIWNWLDWKTCLDVARASHTSNGAMQWHDHSWLEQRLIWILSPPEQMLPIRTGRMRQLWYRDNNSLMVLKG